MSRDQGEGVSESHVPGDRSRHCAAEVLWAQAAPAMMQEMHKLIRIRRCGSRYR